MTIKDFIEKRPYLVWYVSKKDLGKLNEESIVEHVLNYGNWHDVQEMIKILGLPKTARIFREKSQPSKMGRQNYRPEIKYYFNMYFDKYVPQDA
ncbi:MAG TPA: hypothetical protein VJC04_04070 [Candidatus Paceibacterota bacterium]